MIGDENQESLPVRSNDVCRERDMFDILAGKFVGKAVKRERENG